MTALGRPSRGQEHAGESTRTARRAHRSAKREAAVGPAETQRIPPVVALNLGLKFFLELCALAALACWGTSTGPSGTRPLLAIAAPLMAAAAWSLWAAPKSRRRLSRGPRTVVELSVFAAAAVALVAAGAHLIAAAFAVSVLINTGAAMPWGGDGVVTAPWSTSSGRRR